MSIIGAIGLAVGICVLLLLGMMLAWIFLQAPEGEKFDGRETKQLDDHGGDGRDGFIDE